MAALSSATAARAQETTLAQRQAALQAVVDEAVRSTLAKFEPVKLLPSELAVTVLDLTRPEEQLAASHRGGLPIYPASVVKLFYLAAAHQWMEEGKLQDTPELRRAMRDMIVDSYNEATHYVVDSLTGVTSGPELPEAEMAAWSLRRNAVNRHFQALGFTNINVNQKPWCEGPYGRERVFVGREYTNRNMLTTDATARLLAQIATGQSVTKERSAQMLELMARDPSAQRDSEDQASAFTGIALPQGGKLWSKAGWTSQTRHDAAYVELPGGEKIVLVVFTENHANERGVIPAVAGHVFSSLARRPLR